MDHEFITKAFHWILALSPADRKTCAHDLAAAARAGQLHLALTELRSWKETATAVAAGLGSAELAWLDVDEPVERP